MESSGVVTIRILPKTDFLLLRCPVNGCRGFIRIGVKDLIKNEVVVGKCTNIVTPHLVELRIVSVDFVRVVMTPL